MRYSIACGIDNNYVQHASVMLMSLSKTNKDCIFDIYIISLSISDESKDKINSLFSKTNLIIHFIDIDECLLNKFPIRKTDYISIASYLRLFLPVVLPKCVEKVLYLDSDIIINRSIKDLFTIDLSDNFAAACLDVDQSHCCRLNYNISLGYYNSGVFMFNIALFRSVDFMTSVLEFVSNTRSPLSYHDQDILNFLLRGKIKKIEHKWNMLECYYLEKNKRSLYEDIEEGMEDTRIIHYSSSFKPWNFGCKHPKKNEYFKYLKLIPWGNSHLHRYNAFNRLRLWAKIIILLGGSTITIDRIKRIIYQLLNYKKLV